MFGAISAGLGLASTILGNKSAKKQASAARDEAAANRSWQEYMSNTSIQRRMADLKAAGLNPLLAVANAGSGATTPSGSVSGAQANVQRFNASDIAALSNARLVAAQAKAQEQDNDLHEFRKEQLQLQNERERQGILNDVLIGELTKYKTLESRANAYLLEAKKHGVYMDIEKAKKELQILDFDINNIKNTELGQTIDFTKEAFSSPMKAIGSILGGVGFASSKALQGLLNLIKGDKK